MTDSVVKKEITAENGARLVIINLHSPCFKCASARDPLLRHAQPFYTTLPGAIKSFAEHDLAESAKKSFSACENGFSPFAAVMNWELTASSESNVSIRLEISFSGAAGSTREYRTQIWDRRTGARKVFYDFFLPGAEAFILSGAVKETDRALFRRELFALRGEGFEFYLQDGERSPRAVFVAAAPLAAAGYLKDNVM